MLTAIVLLRGINVGGKNSLPMRDLVEILAGMGAESVQTYIQSGNAVFHCTAKSYQHMQQHLAGQILKACGLTIHALVMKASQYQQIVSANPFLPTQDTAMLHVGFLGAKPANPDLAKLDALKAGKEQYHLGKDAFYLYAPDGIGKSKLATGAEKALGVAMTMRNWNTVNKIYAML